MFGGLSGVGIIKERYKWEQEQIFMSAKVNSQSG